MFLFYNSLNTENILLVLFIFINTYHYLIKKYLGLKKQFEENAAAIVGVSPRRKYYTCIRSKFDLY